MTQTAFSSACEGHSSQITAPRRFRTKESPTTPAPSSPSSPEPTREERVRYRYATGQSSPKEHEMERKRLDEEEAARHLDEEERRRNEAEHAERSPRSASQISDSDLQLRPPAEEAPEAKRRRIAISNPHPEPAVCEVMRPDCEGHASPHYRELIAAVFPNYAMPSRILNKTIPQRLGLPKVFTKRNTISSEYVWGQLTQPSQKVISH